MRVLPANQAKANRAKGPARRARASLARWALCLAMCGADSMALNCASEEVSAAATPVHRAISGTPHTHINVLTRVVARATANVHRAGLRPERVLHSAR